MVSSLKRYRIFIIFIALLLFAAVFWFFTMRTSNAKIPSRGVYVFEQLDERMVGNHG